MHKAVYNHSPPIPSELSSPTVRTFISIPTVPIERTAMSIDRETFERATEDELRDVSIPDQVLAFLTAHRDRAFKATEIARQLDLEPDTVSTALTRLKSRDLVEHKSAYWALTSNTDRLQSSADYERATQLFNDQLGAEAKDDWEAHAPAEPHPSVQSDNDTDTNTS